MQREQKITAHQLEEVLAEQKRLGASLKLAPFKELIFERASATEIKKAARGQGMKTLRESGFTKVLEGVTALEEVIRVTDKD